MKSSAVQSQSVRRWPVIRVENPSGVCGYVRHMTIDELKACYSGDDFSGVCPACGFYHMTNADFAEHQRASVLLSDRYQQMLLEVEEKV